MSAPIPSFIEKTKDTHTMSKRTATNAGVHIDLALLRRMAANIRAVEAEPHALAHPGGFQHDRICAANESLLVEGYFSEPLTTFAVGFRDTAALEEELEFVAPAVPVNRRFEYAESTNAEQLLSETTDDERPIKGDFKSVEYTSGKVNAKTVNRGLMIEIDLDEVADKANWREAATGKLISRLRRNSLRRAVALLAAAATNTAKTWDTTAGKDPDQDVISDLVTATTAAGTRPNRVLYGETAWSKRLLAHRAQNSAGGFASAGLTEAQVAAFLAVESVRYSRARYQSAAATKSEIVSNLVIMFNAMTGADTEDPSNIKRFISPVEGGGYLRVYEQQLTAKRYAITVEHYELTKITQTLGVRKFTVS